jgi:hypothetical protein
MSAPDARDWYSLTASVPAVGEDRVDVGCPPRASHGLLGDSPRTTGVPIAAITGTDLSSVLVPSNYWRAAEVISAVEAARVPEVTELREAYRELCGSADDSAPPSLR